MKTSQLISLIFGAAVLVGGGLAVVYLGGGGEQAPAESESSATQTAQDDAGGTAASQQSASTDATTDSTQDSQTDSGQTDSGQTDGGQTDGGQTDGGQTGGEQTVGDQAGDAVAAQPESSESSGTSEAAAAEGDQPAEAGQTQTASLPQDGGGDGEAAQPGLYAPVAPSFDVVRVEPGGETVLAGRAEPYAEVTILDNGEPLGTATADEKGEWVFLPDAPLPPGSRELSLESANENGLKIPSEDVVVMSVPEPRDSQSAAEGSEESGDQQAEQPLAVLQPREGSGASEVLQAPQGEGIAEGSLVLEAVDYGEDGEITVSGRAEPGSAIRLYLDNELVGETTPDDDGRWSYTLDERVPYGVYQLRADQVNESGEVLARVETPFSRVEFARAELPDEKFVIVQPGNSLWRIARSTLGEGVRYSVIYEANADQIRDPNLIYPGQIFAVPRTN